MPPVQAPSAFAGIWRYVYRAVDQHGKVIDELFPAALKNTEQYANHRCEIDHSRLKARLSPMRGLKTDRTPSIVIRGHALVQNLRRGHYELSVDTVPALRLATAFDELR